MKQTTVPGGVARVRGRVSDAALPEPPLSVVHARALYRPVPPVDCDADGYPFSDGSAVESPRHYDARTHLVEVVRVRYADRRDVIAEADLGFYFERGNRSALVVPDAMVVFGVHERPDLSYKLWEQPKVPDLVLEVLSQHSWRKDVHDKTALYRALGVREYWLFDPHGWRRDGGEPLQVLKRSASGDWTAASTTRAGDGLVSEVLGLEVLIRDGQLRFREPGSQDVLPDVVEAARLREELAVQADRETARAARETARAARETARADREAVRADAAQRRVAELEDRLRRAEGS